MVIPRMIPHSDAVGSRKINFLRGSQGKPSAMRRIFPVYDTYIYRMLPAELRESLSQRRPARSSEHVANKQNRNNVVHPNPPEKERTP